MSTLHLAIVTPGGSPLEPRVWSGIPAHVLAELETHDVETVLVGPLSAGYWAGRALSGVTRKIPGSHKVSWEVEPTILRALAWSMDRRLAGCRVDAILALGWTPYPTNRRRAPVWYWGDATYGQRVDQAPHWSGLGRRSRRLLPVTERRALQAMAGVIMPSRWAADDAIARAGIPAERVHVVPFGSNLPTRVRQERRHDPTSMRLLLVGVEWHRKGVDTAVLAADLLREAGVPATLDVVGVTPPDPSWERPYVTYHGRLSMGCPESMARLERLYREAQVFLLPTRNDPFPIVLAEAASFSLPVVAAAVGGVPERVADGRSALLVPAGAAPEAYVAALLRLHHEPELYESLAAGGRQHFEQLAGWNRSVERLLDIIRSSL